MNVLLLQNVLKLGQKGDVRPVSPGYARNFLFPKHLAVPATRDVFVQATHVRERKEENAVHDLEQTEKIAEQLDGLEVEVAGKANESGTLFAAVTKKIILDALQKQGFSLTEKNVALEEPIKELGEHEVRLEFSHGLEANIRVVVTAV